MSQIGSSPDSCESSHTISTRFLLESEQFVRDLNMAITLLNEVHEAGGDPDRAHPVPGRMENDRKKESFTIGQAKAGINTPGRAIRANTDIWQQPGLGVVALVAMSHTRRGRTASIAHHA